MQFINSWQYLPKFEAKSSFMTGTRLVESVEICFIKNWMEISQEDSHILVIFQERCSTIFFSSLQSNKWGGNCGISYSQNETFHSRHLSTSDEQEFVGKWGKIYTSLSSIWKKIYRNLLGAEYKTWFIYIQPVMTFTKKNHCTKICITSKRGGLGKSLNIKK